MCLCVCVCVWFGMPTRPLYILPSGISHVSPSPALELFPSLFTPSTHMCILQLLYTYRVCTHIHQRSWIMYAHTFMLADLHFLQTCLRLAQGLLQGVWVEGGLKGREGQKQIYILKCYVQCYFFCLNQERKPSDMTANTLRFVRKKYNQST